MNNEPVAWMELYYGEPNNLSWTDAELRDSGEVYKTVPLYTHPVKELSEDEIKEVADSVCHDWDEDGLGHLCMVDFARAILRKAQEK